MRSIFLCNSAENIERIFGEEQRREIEKYSMLERNIINERNFGMHDLSDVDFAFSTWGIWCPTEAQLDKLPKLRAIFYAAGATDGFCRPFLRRNIKVISGWRANARPVAEFTVANIILGLKNAFQLMRMNRSKAGMRQELAGNGSYHSRVALLGAGAM